jgi:hypothetical protein
MGRALNLCAPFIHDIATTSTIAVHALIDNSLYLPSSRANSDLSMPNGRGIELACAAEVSLVGGVICRMHHLPKRGAP